MKFKVFYVVLALLLVFGSYKVNADTVYYTNSNGIGMTEQQYNNLLQLGFTVDEIYAMDLEMFNDNKDIEATLVSEQYKYYKTTTVTQNGISTSRTEEVSAEEAMNASVSNNARSGYDGYIETTYKRLGTTISQIDSDSFRYKTTLEWRQMPSKRSFDIIGIGFQQVLVQRTGSIYFRQNYTKTDGTTGTSYVCIPMSHQMGGTVVFQLLSGTYSQLSSLIYYDVIKAHEDYTVTEMYAGGDYSHATSNISETNAQKHSVNHAGGIILEDSIEDYYDTTPLAQASWYGTW